MDSVDSRAASAAQIATGRSIARLPADSTALSPAPAFFPENSFS
jgi:hypothetical protein